MDNVRIAVGERIRENAELVETALERYFDYTDADYGKVIESQKYSLLGGGKRIRPFLTNEVCRMLGGSVEASMPLACAVEMIHTYSLIHDDLPCLDNDDIRRGKPSNHKVYGYAGAMLAGDALLTRAFGVIASAHTLSAQQKASAIAVLADAAGDRGMIGGQVIDLDGENSTLSFEKLLKLHAHKTGAIIKCAAVLGCIAAGLEIDASLTGAIATYAEKIGLAFQVIDDILDATSTQEELGKSVGSDADNNKTTFLTFYSIDEATQYAARLTKEAIAVIGDIPSSEVLCELARELLERKN